MAVSNEVVLSGQFLCGRKRFILTLTSTVISWKPEDSEMCTVVPLNRLIAATPCDCPKSKLKQAQCHPCVLLRHHLQQSFVEVLPFHAKSLRLHFAVPHGKHSWRINSQVFYPAETASLKGWLSTLQNILLDLNRPKKLLVFVNPYGGKKQGVKIYEKKILPLFHLAGIEAQMIVTQRANHAKEILEEVDIYKFDGIISVGGDGMFSEILNSILLKTQKEKGIDINDTFNPLISPRVSLGIIPAGSTNAVAYCTTGSDDPVSAALLIIMGDNIGVDVCAVHNHGRFIRFAVTFLSYGYFGDVILDSEKFRYLGPKRYEFSGFKKLLSRKLYSGELQLQVASLSENSTWKHEKCRIGCSDCMKAKEKCQNLDLANSSEKMSWIRIRRQFMAVSAAILSCACERARYGISPSQHIGNGFCDVIVVSANSRLDYLKYISRTAYNYKDPLDLDFVEIYRVKAFMFNPYACDDKTPDTGCTGIQDSWQRMQNSVWNCDGDVMNEPSIYAKIHCQLVNVFGRGFEDRVMESHRCDCFGFCKKK